MTSDEANTSLPQGVNILKSANVDKTYVINEVLNFYQRKMRVLGIAPLKNLSHHVFKPEQLNEARDILRSLWVWRNLEPIPAHVAIVEKLT